MTDEELIKRLHNFYTKSGVEGYYTKANTVTFAADRIELLATTNEELEAKLSKTEGLLAENEVRLRKAVETLEYYNVAGHEGKEARAALAEIKLQSSEFATQKGETHE